jgi:hypothetical protein
MTRADAKREVGTTSAVSPATLTTYPRNARQGDVAAIAASLKAHGQYKPVVVNIGTGTGRHNEVLAGNHTLLAFRELAQQHPDDPRWANILVHWVNVDDDMAARIVVADNRTSELGGFDVAVLAELLDGMTGNLDGLGYSTADIADLTALVQETTLPDNLNDLFTDPFSAPTTDSSAPMPDAPKPPRMGDDGLVSDGRRGIHHPDKTDVYADQSASRMVVLTMPIPVFIWVQEQLEAVRAAFSADNNTDAVVKLLEQWSNTTAPTDTVAAE